MRGEDRGVVVELVGKSMSGVPLVVGLLDRDVRRDEVGPADTAVEQPASGEDDRIVADPHGVRHVIRRVAGSMDDLDTEFAHREGITVVDLGRGVLDVESGRDDVGGTVLARELDPT